LTTTTSQVASFRKKHRIHPAGHLIARARCRPAERDGVPIAVPKDTPVQPQHAFVVDKSGQLQ
jgi:hypothetical protein